MTTPPDTFDQLVSDYLDTVENASTGLPADRRRELLSDLRAHIEAERAALASPTEAAVRDILDRLGDPESLAAEARFIEDPLMPPAARSGNRRFGVPGRLLVALGLAVLLFLLLGLAVASGRGGTHVEPAPGNRTSTAQPR